MIYLIRSTWYDFATSNNIIIDLVKIGYTENFDKRWKAYKLHNPICKVISTIEDGTEDDERRLHYHFKDFIYPDYGREWFTYDQSIIDFFDTHRTSDLLSSLPLPPKEEELLTDNMILKNWLNENSESLSDVVKDWLDLYLKERQFVQRLKSFCELTEEDKNFLLEKLPIELPFKDYYLTLGSSRCKSLSYRKCDIEREMNIITFNTRDVRKELDYLFKEGEVYLLSDIKDTLKKVYESLWFKKTPKATDLSEYYEISRKRVNQKEAFKIIKKL